MKVVIYVRVSTDQQDYNRQIDDIEKYCSREELEIVKVFSEKESGRVKVRPVLSEMLEFVTNPSNSIDLVVVSELSRLGRTSEVIGTIERLNSFSVGLFALKENLRTLNPDKSINHTSGMVIGIMSSLNAYEIEQIKYRSQSGKLRAVLSGNWGSGKLLPYGYMKVGKKLVVNPDEREMIVNIFNMYLEGNGTKKIANYQNFKNYPTRTGVSWRDKNIYDILKNPLYIGKRIYQGQTVDCPQIIDEFVFKSANELLKSKNNKQGTNAIYDHLLNKQIITCGVCGKSYFAHKRANGNDNAYKCISIRYGNNCGNTSISIDKLNNVVTYLSIVPLMNYVQENGNSQESKAKISEQIEVLKFQYEKTEKQKNRLVDLYVEEKIKLNDFNSRTAKFEKEQEKIQSEIKSLISELMKIDSLKGLNIDTISKKEIHTIVKSIVINPSKEVIGTNKQDKSISVKITFIDGFETSVIMSQRCNYFIQDGKMIDIVKFGVDLRSVDLL